MSGECPNCGAGIDVVQYLDDRYGPVPPQVPTGVPRHYRAAERWIVSSCRGVRPIINGGVFLAGAEPCGWFRWTHDVDPLAAYGVILPTDLPTDLFAPNTTPTRSDGDTVSR